MLPEKKTNTNIGIGVGIILQIAGNVLSRSDSMGLVGVLIAFVGLGFFIWGCMNYAMGKGHSKWLGLLGLLSCLGLIVLIILPDHHKNAS
jgi:TRAP-type C4-dicarboxylate transport system permease small subunit